MKLINIDGATVTLTNTTTGFTTATSASKKGYFTFSDVPVGTYTIEVSGIGFQATVLKDNALNLGDNASTNSYKYSVNTNAGTKQKTANYYAVQFGVKYSF